MSRDGRRLYVADTNNHCIKVVYLEEKRIDKVNHLLQQCGRRLSLVLGTDSVAGDGHLNCKLRRETKEERTS